MGLDSGQIHKAKPGPPQIICDVAFLCLVTLSLSLCPGSYMYVDVSQYDIGEKARFQLPVMKENDTHCIDFNYLLTSPDGSSPGTLNVLVNQCFKAAWTSWPRMEALLALRTIC